MRKSLELKWWASLVLAALGMVSSEAACTYSITPSGRSHGNGSATNTFVVSAATGCAWNVVNTNSWITLMSAASGTGTGTVTYVVSAQIDSIARGGSLVVSGQVFNVTQDGIACNYAVSPISRNHGASGAGSANPPNPIQVAAATNCTWTATTTNSWITFPSSISGVSTGAVAYHVAANWTPVWRTGLVNIANRTTTISQNPASCLYELSPTNRLHGFAGSTGKVDVLPIPGGSGCTWFVNNTNPWITITVNAFGTNTGSFGYNVGPNPNNVARTGSFNVWDQFFTVFQNATPCSNAMIVPTSANPDAEAQSNSVSVTPVGGCPGWMVVNTNSWISVSPMSGAGNGSVTWSVALNSGVTGRTGVVRIAEQNFTVRQGGAACDYKLSTTNRQHGYSATTNSVQLTVLSICPWSIQNTNPWINILTATNGTGSSSNAYALLQNTNANDRTGRVFIAGQVLVIRQLGVSCALSLSPLNRNHGHGPATNTIIVNTPVGCAWEVLNTNTWIQFVSPTNGSGSNSLSYTITANPSTSARSGVISINEGNVVISQDGAPCLPSISPNNETHTADTATGQIAVTAPIGCAWAVVNTNSWVTLLSGTSGSGSASVSYSVSGNANPLTRYGNLTVAGQLYAITQEGVNCNYRLSPTNRTHGSGVNTNTLTMNVASPCPWVVVNTNSWITILSGTNGVGSNIISYAIAANNSTETRVGSITAEGAVTVITQNGVVCSYSLSPSGRNHGYAATNASITVSAPGGCSWNVVNTNAWVSITSPANGVGDGAVSYAITANNDPATRTGNIQIDGQLFALSQSPVTCSYRLSPSGRNHGYVATNASIAMIAPPGCAWNVVNTNAWVTINSATNGVGDGTVSYSVSSNNDLVARAGNIAIGGELFAISQSAVGCDYKLTPSGRNHGHAATNASIAMTAPAGCAWNVVNTNAWLSITSATNGVGDGMVSYSISANNSIVARTGNIAIGGELFAISQSAVGCDYKLTPSGRNHGHAATNASIAMTAPAGCAWNVVNTNAWLSITSTTNGVGDGMVSYSISANNSIVARTGNIAIGGELFAISQSAVGCDYKLTPSGRNHGHAATNATIAMTAPAGCAWSVVNTNPWVSITSATNGLGDGTISYTVSSNIDLATRTGNIEIGGELFALSQSAVGCSYKLSPTNRNHGFGATTNSLVITAGPTCTWNIATTNTWITFLTPTNGLGNSNVTYTISANFENDTRLGYITLLDEVLVLTQSAPTNGFVFELVTVSPAGDLNVRLGGGPAGIWELQSSTNLTDWSRIAYLTNTTGRVDYQAPPPLAPMKYLRAVLP